MFESVCVNTLLLCMFVCTTLLCSLCVCTLLSCMLVCTILLCSFYVYVLYYYVCLRVCV